MWISISSLSKAEYCFWALLNFLEKNARGLHFWLTNCSSTAPIPRSLASVVRAVGASRLGWLSRAAEERADFAALKADSTSGDHWICSCFFLPAMAANNG